MATTADTTPDTPYADHVEDIKTWLDDTAQNDIDSPDQRTWNTLELTSLLTKDIEDYFSNNDVNSQYQAEWDKGTLTNIPVAYMQLESDSLHGLFKMYVYRHAPRLANYRNDMENKSIRTFSSLSLALAKISFLEQLAVNPNQTTVSSTPT
jgi:hypothetical protein